MTDQHRPPSSGSARALMGFGSATDTAPDADPSPAQPPEPAPTPAAAPVHRTLSPQRLTHEIYEFLSGSKLSRELQTHWETIRKPAVSGRRVGLHGLHGGVGTTTAATLLAQALSSVRAEPVLILDLAAHRSTAAQRLGAEDRSLGKVLTQLLKLPPNSNPERAREILGLDQGGVSCLSLGPDQRLKEDHWRRLMGTLSRSVPFTVIDLGSGYMTPNAAKAAGHCHTVISVSAPGRQEPQEEPDAHLADHLQPRTPVLKLLSKNSTRRRLLGGHAVTMPWDPRAALDGECRAEKLRRRSRTALLRLTGRAAEAVL